MKIEELKTEKCLEILKSSHFGRIACSFDDQPYVVPFNFVYDRGEYLYAFSTLGQKILWMRKNPLVCIEIEDVNEQDDWTTIVIFGRFEELPDEPEFQTQRIYAHELLSQKPMWWQTAFAAGAKHENVEEIPVYYRIYIERISGHRAFNEDLKSFLTAKKSSKVSNDLGYGIW